ncbi:MAG: ferrous iron transport protein A [Clostridia bacterium]|nr:ferrous iron transport protein A [Clostridia bacterium]
MGGHAALLRHLGDLGLKPGARVRVLEREPFDGSMRVECDGRDFLVSGRVADAVAVHA